MKSRNQILVKCIVIILIFGIIGGLIMLLDPLSWLCRISGIMIMCIGDAIAIRIVYLFKKSENLL